MPGIVHTNNTSSDVTGLTNRVTTLENDLGTAEGNITTLQGDVSTLQTASTKYATDIADLQNDDITLILVANTSDDGPHIGGIAAGDLWTPVTLADRQHLYDCLIGKAITVGTGANARKHTAKCKVLIYDGTEKIYLNCDYIVKDWDTSGTYGTFKLIATFYGKSGSYSPYAKYYFSPDPESLNSYFSSYESSDLNRLVWS